MRRKKRSSNNSHLLVSQVLVNLERTKLSKKKMKRSKMSQRLPP